MKALRHALAGGMFAVAWVAASAQASGDAAPTAQTIMALVAANQDRAEEARTHYVYVQHAKVTSRRGTKVMCEEDTDSRITPSPGGSHAQLLKLQGRFLHKKKYVVYTTLAEGKKGSPVGSNVEAGNDSLEIGLGEDDMDRSLVEGMRADLTRSDSKDGMDRRLFPLTSKEQSEYEFNLVGRERMNGRDVYHLTFRPKDKSSFDWKGDAYIDTAAYQPVVVTTEMSRKIPFAVRTLLGTNVPGLGFAINYAPQADGVWFPVSFGTEFKLHVLFFLNREIVIDAHNAEFEKTHVSSRILENPETGQAP